MNMPIAPLPEIAPCPNPECRTHAKLRVFHKVTRGYGIDANRYQVVDDYCGYRGPLADTREEAIRLHNLICRPSASAREAAREMADEIMETQFKVEDFEERDEAFKRAYYRERDDVEAIIQRHIAGGWIPCSERMPFPHRDKLLVCLKERKDMGQVWYARYGEWVQHHFGWKVWFDDGYVVLPKYAVSHWMPIPGEPK